MVGTTATPSHSGEMQWSCPGSLTDDLDKDGRIHSWDSSEICAAALLSLAPVSPAVVQVQGAKQRETYAADPCRG
jgi:hypothetical protein